MNKRDFVSNQLNKILVRLLFDEYTGIKKVIESQKNDEDPKIRKKAKNQLKKIQRVLS